MLFTPNILGENKLEIKAYQNTSRIESWGRWLIYLFIYWHVISSLVSLYYQLKKSRILYVFLRF